MLVSYKTETVSALLHEVYTQGISNIHSRHEAPPMLPDRSYKTFTVTTVFADEGIETF
jgi:hypothetical protein